MKFGGEGIEYGSYADAVVRVDSPTLGHTWLPDLAEAALEDNDEHGE